MFPRRMRLLSYNRCQGIKIGPACTKLSWADKVTRRLKFILSCNAPIGPTTRHVLIQVNRFAFIGDRKPSFLGLTRYNIVQESNIYLVLRSSSAIRGFQHYSDS